jgi:hypothetical protein
MIFDTLAYAIPAEQVPHKFPAPKYAEQVKHMDSHIFASRRGNTMLQNTASAKTWQRYQYHPSQSLADQSWEARVAGVKWSENRRCLVKWRGWSCEEKSLGSHCTICWTHGWRCDHGSHKTRRHSQLFNRFSISGRKQVGDSSGTSLANSPPFFIWEVGTKLVGQNSLKLNLTFTLSRI